MQKFKGSQGILLVYGSIAAILSILVLIWILSSPSEPGNTIFLGLSLPRILFAFVLLAALVFFTSITIKASRDQAWAEKILDEWFGGGRFSGVTAWLAGISFGLGWIGCFLPSYRVGIFVNYWIRIRPVMVFILVVGMATLALILIRRSQFSLKEIGTSTTFKLSLVLFLGFLFGLGFMIYSGFGIRSSEDFWYGAGVPILASQSIVAILGGIFFLQFEKRSNRGRSDLIVFALIYIVTAIFWVREPLQGSFLFPGPYPPNHVLYPFADGATFDSASQFALIGQGILNGQFFERSLYVSFLVYLHSLFGQDYEILMAVQAGIFAIFPGLVYLIGRSLNIRAVGLASAIVAMLRGINSISASNMIDMANPKMILTDFPAAIGMVIIILLTCEWLKRPAQKPHNALWIGGAIGFTLMLRSNALIFLVFLPLYAFLRFSPEWKKWLTGSFLIVLGMIAITLPWELKNQARGGVVYGSYLAKFQNVIRERYISPLEPGGFLPQPKGHALAVASFKNTQAILVLSQNAVYTAQNTGTCNTVFCFAPNHFLHNIVTSVLILPTSPVLDDLRHTVKENNPYWEPDWDGFLTISSLFFLGLNIYFVVLGISVAWKEHRLHGMAPLAIFMFYNVSNALARTSGGRYLVPMDWIISIYFLSGVFQLITWLANASGIKWEIFSAASGGQGVPRNIASRNVSSVAIILVALFSFGSFVPLSENFRAQRYQNIDPTKALMEREQAITNAGMDMNDIDSFLKSPNAELLIGRVLYPRYYPIDRGEILLYPFIALGFPRTALMLIGPEGERGVILPGDVPEYFPHAVDALVLGCKEEKYLDALAVILLDENDAVYTRAPESDLQCPLKQPVCDDNRVCR